MNRDGRYAPSPTGDLHLGNLRTALLAWLFARSAGARFPDADRGPRRRARAPGVAESQLATWRRSAWTGRRAGAQSDRAERYADALARLEAAGRLYPASARGQRSARPLGAARPLREGAYPGTCRKLTAPERAGARRRAAGRLCASTPAARSHVRGPGLGRDSAAVDDFVVRRNDGAPAYQLAVVVDDAAQGSARWCGRRPARLDPAPARAGGGVGPPLPRVRARAARAGPDGSRLASATVP